MYKEKLLKKLWKFKNKVANLPLYNKFLYIIITSIVFILIVFFFSTNLLTQEYDKMLYETNAALLKNVSTSIESSLKEIETISYSILTDNYVQDNLIDLNNAQNNNRIAITRRNLYQTLNTYTFYNKYVKSMVLYFPDKQYINLGNNEYIESFNIDEIEALADEASGKVVWSAQKESGKFVACTRRIRQIKYLTLTDLASLYIIIDIDAVIEDALRSAGYTSDNSNFVLIANEKRIYPELSYQDDIALDLVKEKLYPSNSYNIISIDGKEQFIIKGNISPFNWNYVYFRDYESVFNQVLKTKYITLGTTLLFSMCILFLVRIFLKNILWHIDFLIQKIQTFGETGDISQDIYRYKDRTDEICQLHHSFDMMTKNVKMLRDENHEKQILLKDTRIKMLQQQINPHFLYNTLDTVNWLAQKYGANDISTITHSLASLFRYSVSSQEDLIPLCKELSILDSYINIQKIRFKDRMNFYLETPMDISDIYVPKLCIQPLVENALKYSLEYNDEYCNIHVTVKEEENDYIIKVSNTGSQFEDNLLDKLRNNEIISQGSGIGLNNISKRLELLYGSNYGLKLYNIDEMATVLLQIPKKL